MAPRACRSAAGGAPLNPILPHLNTNCHSHPRRYDAAKQRSLSLHCDQSEFSLTISMNPAGEYAGGGTYFARRCEAVNCAEAGGVVSFRGSLLHGGHPITSGTRYIIVVFAHAYRAPPEDGRADDLVG